MYGSSDKAHIEQLLRCPRSLHTSPHRALMAGRAQPLEWKPRFGASIKQFGRKVANLYENRHESSIRTGSSVKNRSVRSGSSTPRRGAISDSTLPATATIVERDFVSAHPWTEDSGDERVRDTGRGDSKASASRAQQSFVSISDSDDSRPSDEYVHVQDPPHPAQTRENEPGSSLESLISRAGLDTDDPLLLRQLIGVLEDARRRKNVATPSPSDAYSPAALPRRPRTAQSGKSGLSVQNRGTSISGVPPAPGRATSSSRFDPAARPFVPSRPLPPPPPPPPSALHIPEAAHIRLPPSPELARPTHSLDEEVARASSSSSPIGALDREAVVRSYAHDPEAALAFLQELMRQVSVSQSPRPSSPSSLWPDEHASRAETLPPYRRDVPNFPAAD